MYEIRKGGEVLALAETPNFIYQHPEGFYVLCEQAEAKGVAVNGTPYSLNGTGGIEGCEEVVLVERDTGELLHNTDNVNGIVFVTMAEKGDIDTVTAEEHAELFAPWVYPAAYQSGNLRRYNGRLYKCISDHTSQADWAPDVAVSLWVATSDPAEEYPAWSQPVGAHDAYNTGDKVTHNEKKWASTCDGNVWEPGVYGWEEVSE